MHGPTLNNYHQAILADIASGLDTYAIAKKHNLTQSQMLSVTLDIQARLQANNVAHLINRAWQLGLLSLKQGCLVVLVCVGASQLDHKATRLTVRVNVRAPIVRTGRV
jgi:DNA-binding CsgD family transcriptional regulator